MKQVRMMMCTSFTCLSFVLLKERMVKDSNGKKVKYRLVETVDVNPVIGRKPKVIYKYSSSSKCWTWVASDTSTHKDIEQLFEGIANGDIHE